MNDDTVIVRYLKSEDRCQVILDKFIQALDREYKSFLDRKTPYNKRVSKKDGSDENWRLFCSNAQEMGMGIVLKMGLRDYDAEEVLDSLEYVENKREFRSLIGGYKKTYNKAIAEVFDIICRIDLNWSDKYIYVWNEKSLRARSGAAAKDEHISDKVKNVQPYIEEIVAGLTEQVLDNLYDKGEKDLVADEQLSLLFYPKFKEDEECEYPESREFALRYNDKKEEMVLFSNYHNKVLWSVKCEVDNVQSIISCAIDCINHCIQ